VEQGSELEKTIEAALYRLEADAATIERHPDSTIVPRFEAPQGTDDSGGLLAGLGATTISGKLELH